VAADSGVRRRDSLLDLAWLFLKLGTIGFGGPAAHIALMEDEVVRRRGWMTRETFVDHVGAMNLIPGPNSTELAIAIGRDRAGWPGLIVAGVAFIVPAAVIVSVIAWLYVQYGRLPGAIALLDGVKPVIIAIVAQALWRLGRTALKNAWLLALALGSAGAVLGGANELAVLVLAGAIASSFGPRQTAEQRDEAPNVPVDATKRRPGVAIGALGALVVAPAGVGLWPLFTIFLKIGSVLFGSGYVLLAFLQADFVERHRWLTEAQLLDAIVIGQVTPGPVFTTATFIGYVLAGLPGAVVATIGIFLPAFVLVAVSGPLIPRIRRSRIAGAALDGVNAASLALMAVVTWQLGETAFTGVWTVLLAGTALFLLTVKRVNATWVVFGGALIGALSAWIR
jgi:chromate transporter